MYKRLLVFAVVLALLAIGIGATSQPTVAQMKIVYNSYASDPIPRAYTEQLVANWNAANPDMPVELNIINHEDFKQAIRTYLVAEPAPDVLDWFAGNRAQFFISRGLIADFSDVWESEGWDEVYPAGFKALATVDDKQYFLPNNYYWWALYFRPSILADAGLEAPQTWDDLLNACRVLNDKGIIPITIGTKAPWPAAAWFDYINMRLNGPQFHLDLMLLKESYTDPRVKATFMKWKELFDNKCYIPDSAALEWGDALTPMAQGKAAMYVMGGFITDSWQLAAAGDEALMADLDFTRFPIIDPMMPIGEDAPTDGVFLAAKAGNLEMAKKFLAYLGSQEVAQRGVDELGRLPVRTDVSTERFTDAQKKGISLIQSADMVVQFYDRDTTPEMAERGLNAFASFFADPSEANIDALLADLEETRARLAAEQANE
jgi:multiple sugar transport system substrate-binding protein/raffinose/stachyose/melibiose transport system substrate-binding protein